MSGSSVMRESVPFAARAKSDELAAGRLSPDFAPAFFKSLIHGVGEIAQRSRLNRPGSNERDRKSVV